VDKPVKQLSMEQRRKMRQKNAAKNTHLSTRIDTPFFSELLSRWPDPVTMEFPVSQMCTTGQFDEPDYIRLRKQMKLPRHLHRKQWEFVYILRSLEATGMIKPGSRGVVFGVGREKLPAVLIKRGCDILATDLPLDIGASEWIGGAQHSSNLEGIFHPHLVDRALFDAHAQYRPVNMKSIPADITGYDFCWSSCALEHLGSLRDGLDFIVNSLKCLRPGGVAVHTTEFNLGSATDTLESGPSVVYRESDLLAFADELKAAGHFIELNLHPGGAETDKDIDRDRSSDIHLRLYVRHKIAATSVGLVVRKAA
jgi:hypothetical protein